MTSPFTIATGGGGGVAAADLENHNLIVTVVEHIASMPTANGDREAVRVNVVDLDSEDGPEEHNDVLFFGKVLVGGLRGNVGKPPVLGKMTKGTAQPGKNAPWVLNPVEDDVVARATAYWTQRTFTAPLKADAQAAEPVQSPKAAAASGGLPAETEALIATLPPEQQEAYRRSLASLGATAVG